MNIDPNDDQALTKLYKSGAKETPSSQLDRKILDYAVNKNRPGLGGSHFGGDWKVPLSLAASVLLVFTILVQLDKNPEQLPKDLPPLPSTEKKADVLSVPADSEFGYDKNRSLNEAFESPSESESQAKSNKNGIEFEAEESLGNSATPALPAIPENKVEARKKLQRQNQEVLSQPEAILEQSAPSDDYQPSSEAVQSREVSPQKTPQRAPELSKDSLKEPAKESAGKAKQSTVQENNGDRSATTESIERDEAIQLESNHAQQPASSREDDSLIVDKIEQEAEDEAEFAALPVDDWLLTIEKLIANENYAEAVRELEKFKQAHPEINVLDLESKIP